ncbi:hypothetical protein AMECASPLE_039718 [Ameca splendens]|uniref:Uncharacterized protein n=1 Tax=Ameca splendens TaxID=208324 RepID=A0ABV0ZUM2_9TELE
MDTQPDTDRQKQPVYKFGTFITVGISLTDGGLMWLKVVGSCYDERKSETEKGREGRLRVLKSLISIPTQEWTFSAGIKTYTVTITCSHYSEAAAACVLHPQLHDLH